MTTSAPNTYTITLESIDKAKKNFFAMYYFYKNWGLLFVMQNLTQELLPYLYILLLETAVAFAFTIQCIYELGIL